MSHERPVNKFSLDGKFIKEYPSTKEAARYKAASFHVRNIKFSYLRPFKFLEQ